MTKRKIVIGDIHGCYYTFESLLSQFNFDAKQDQLFLLGDLVGKGSNAHLVLDFCMELPFCKIVLGNHDITWLNAYSYPKYDALHDSVMKVHKDTQKLLNSSRAEKWFNFLLNQSFVLNEDFHFQWLLILQNYYHQNQLTIF